MATRSLVIAEDVPAADGQTYRVLLDVDELALRRGVPQLVARSLAPSLVALDALKLRLEPQD
jgi:hypothetical protein